MTLLYIGASQYAKYYVNDYKPSTSSNMTKDQSEAFDRNMKEQIRKSREVNH
jgi:hypothetical protein